MELTIFTITYRVAKVGSYMAKKGFPLKKYLDEWPAQRVSLPSPAVCNNIGVEAYGDVTQLPKLTWEFPDHGIQDCALDFSCIISTGTNIGNHVLPSMYIMSKCPEHRHNSFWESCLGEKAIWKSRSWMHKKRQSYTGSLRNKQLFNNQLTQDTGHTYVPFTREGMCIVYQWGMRKDRTFEETCRGNWREGTIKNCYKEEQSCVTALMCLKG